MIETASVPIGNDVPDYFRKLTDEELEKLNKYLKDKYGISGIEQGIYLNVVDLKEAVKKDKECVHCQRVWDCSTKGIRFRVSNYNGWLYVQPVMCIKYLAETLRARLKQAVDYDLQTIEKIERAVGKTLEEMSFEELQKAFKALKKLEKQGG